MKVLIVGAGFYGAVLARELHDFGIDVHVIEKRDHIGGNAYDYVNEKGILIHKYGPHIFHTNNKKVFNYLSKYTEWVEYKHEVKALLDNGSYVTLPVNQETKNIVGEDNIIDIFYQPYTKKMWDKDIHELDPSIINRVKVRNDNNNYYFPNDKYQFMPKHGYTQLFENLLYGINVSLNTKFAKHMEDNYDFVFNSMPIDQYFDYTYGKLPYRSIKFHNINIPKNKMFPKSVVNFTDNSPYTRVTEWKHFPNNMLKNNAWTTLTFEEPCDFIDNNYERYYPVKDIDKKNRKLYEKYKELVPDKVTFIGRCGLYVYIDMDQAVSSSLALSKKFLK